MNPSRSCKPNQWVERREARLSLFIILIPGATSGTARHVTTTDPRHCARTADAVPDSLAIVIHPSLTGVSEFLSTEDAFFTRILPRHYSEKPTTTRRERNCVLACIRPNLSRDRRTGWSQILGLAGKAGAGFSAYDASGSGHFSGLTGRHRSA